MIRARALASVGAVLGAALLPAAAIQAQNSTATTAADHKAVIQQYCVACHSGPTPFARLDLEKFDFDHFDKDGVIWEKLIRKVRMRAMPPAGMPRPPDAAYEGMVKFMEAGRDKLAETTPNPGRPTLHRLNRTEYANAVRDLLAIEVDVSELLPADDIGYGFDNIGDVLQVSPFLMERYLGAARKISRTAVGDPSMPVTYQTYNVHHGLVQYDRQNENAPVGSRGGTVLRHLFPVDGDYEISVTVQRSRDDEYLGFERERKLDLRLDNQRLQLFTLAASEKKIVLGSGKAPDADMKVRIPVKAGPHEVGATFLKDTVLKEGIIERVRDDNVQTYFEGVATVTVAGPFNVTGPGETASRDKIFICRPTGRADEEACAQRVLSNLAHRAYRRPVTNDDTAPLLALYRQGAQNGGFDAGIRLAMQKVLVSPDFIFRAEVDPANAQPGTVYRVSDVELASRLSFFLWSSIPDDELLSVAEAGRLKEPAVLQAQVKRMLADSRSSALVKNFAGQWLFLRNIERIAPDSTSFPNFDENLRHALQRETELLIESQVKEDRGVGELLTTDYTFLNERLAEHYGMKGIYGSEFRRVKLEDPNRHGLLGQASILTVTSYPNRTAPTIRGKWVLEQLLGTPPPPPPPNVPSLKNDATTAKLTMRQRMEAHRANPACAACHRQMDPLGFALENFDGLGGWRAEATPGSGPMDTSGELPDGSKFNGPAGLRDVLVKKQDAFIETFTERLLTYALGRGVEEYDFAALRKVTRDAAKDNQKWSAIILGIVNSTPFQMRRVSDGNT